MKSCPRNNLPCSKIQCVASNLCQIEDDLYKTLSFIDSQTPTLIESVSIPTIEIRGMYAGLGRAIESGDPLQIGLILGQVYKELEKYVNTSTTGDNRAPISFNQEGKGIQPVSHGGSGSASGDKEGDIPTSSNEA